MKKYIHVNQHVIRSNKKNNENNPVLSIKEGRKNTYCHRVKILGPSEVVYSGNDKLLLPCGARVAIVTESEIEILEQTLKQMNKEVILEIAKKAGIEEKDREKIVLFAELLKNKIFEELQRYLKIRG